MAHMNSFSLFLITVPLFFSSVAPSSVLFRNATIATWDDSTQAIEVYRQSSILVQGDKIERVYQATEGIPDSMVEVVDASNKIIVPGFVDTHHHTWQAIYKTFASNTTLFHYLPRWSGEAPFSHTLTAEEIYRSQLMGALGMLNEGTTSWLDIHGTFSNDTIDAALRATSESGGRAFFGTHLHQMPGFPLADQVAKFRALANNPEYANNSSLVRIGLSYDGFWALEDTESRASVYEILDTANMSFITTHDLGGAFGLTNSPETLHKDWALLNKSTPIVFAHASYVTPTDAMLLRQTNQYISTTPESEIHYGHGNPQQHLIQDQTSLGVDTPFTYSVSLVGQARLWLQQLRGRLFQQQLDQWVVPMHTPMSVNQAFYQATRAGALALRRPDLGIIAEGAKADFVVYDTNGLNMLGWRDPVAAVILHSNPGDISDVVVGGNFVKRNFKSTLADFDELRRDFGESAREVEKRAAEFEFPDELPGLNSVAPTGRAMDIDAVRGNVTG